MIAFKNVKAENVVYIWDFQVPAFKMDVLFCKLNIFLWALDCLLEQKNKTKSFEDITSGSGKTKSSKQSADLLII